jgi:hypothetical protein
MVVNFETPFYEFSWGSVQHEDTYLITEGEPLRLGKLDPEILWAGQ